MVEKNADLKVSFFFFSGACVGEEGLRPHFGSPSSIGLRDEYYIQTGRMKEGEEGVR